MATPTAAKSGNISTGTGGLVEFFLAAFNKILEGIMMMNELADYDGNEN